MCVLADLHIKIHFTCRISLTCYRLQGIGTPQKRRPSEEELVKKVGIEAARNSKRLKKKQRKENYIPKGALLNFIFRLYDVFTTICTFTFTYISTLQL